MSKNNRLLGEVEYNWISTEHHHTTHNRNSSGKPLEARRVASGNYEKQDRDGLT